MKKLKSKCPMCEKSYEYIDVRSKPPTCGRRACAANYKYQQKHMDPLTGEKPTPGKIGKL